MNELQGDKSLAQNRNLTDNCNSYENKSLVDG